ncbi:MAG: molybdopterin molybdotransferase MoeA [Chloroflexota bacterium]|nr:molybdopterin molybdotransferase MoeA [Chloroflexota bacterium]
MQTHLHREPMLSVEEAQERILAHFAPLSAVEVPLDEGLGLVLAEDVRSPLDVPPWDNAAMDGYAVRWEDIRGASPSTPRLLRVVGMVAAGQMPSSAVLPGTAVRIMTGAPIPPGADTVVPFEETDEEHRRRVGRGLEHISILGEVPQGAHIRPRAGDIRRDEIVLPRGTVLGPAQIGVLASLGRATVRVVRRPVVAVLSTGDELLAPGEPLQPGKIYDINSHSVGAAVRQAGGIPLLLGIAQDDLEDVRRKVQEGLQADFLLTSAGVSKGDYDIVKDVLAQQGRVEFWTVRMRPGKPMAFGWFLTPDGRRVPHLGLPGNPVSALVVFELFCRPAIFRMLGRKDYHRPVVQATLDGRIVNSDGRRVYARVVVERRGEGWVARPAGPQASHILTALARANGLAICPEDVPALETGARVQVILLDGPVEVAR